MEDRQIIELFFARDERAISETALKYERYCNMIANNILHDDLDSEECVNDAYLAAWNSIPPTNPDSLSAYLARLTRNLSINRYKSNMTQRRGGGEFALSLDELDDCIAAKNIEERELGSLINDFLSQQKKEMRQVFVRRYFYSDSISDIAKRFAMSESKVKSMLHRTRLSLKDFLAEHDVQI